MTDLEEVERSQFEDTDDPRKGSLGAVGEQDHLQTTGHQGAVEDVLFQQNLPKKKKNTHTICIKQRESKLINSYKKYKNPVKNTPQTCV